jgi:fucose permease
MAVSTAVQHSAPATRSIVVLHLGFIVTGMVNTMLGPLLPILSGRWALSDAQSGYFFAAQFGASIVGVTLSSALVPRWGSRLTLIIGFLIMGSGTAALTLDSWGLAILGAFGSGMGFGLTIPTTNLLVSELKPEHRAAALNLVNFSWGIGAVTGPFLIAGLQRTSRVSLFMFIILGLCVFVALIVSTCNMEAHAEKQSGGSDPKAWRSKYVPVLAAVFFLYVGSEASVGGWIAALARRTVAASGTAWVLTPSFFWATLLIGRASAPAILRRIPELVLARIGVALATAGTTLFLLAGTIWVLGFGVALAGLGFASVYPIAISVLSHHFGKMAARIGGLLFSLAGLGGMVMPWVVGLTSTHFASLRTGLLVPLLGCVAMFGLYTLLAIWSADGPYAASKAV